MIKVTNKSTLNLLIFAILLFAVRFYLHQKEIEQAKNAYIDEQNVKSIELANTLNDKLKSSYETLRTISLLPGVRSIESTNQKLSPDTNGAVQQLYNNIYNNIHVSEIYILPKDFNHDLIDPNTKKLQEPIIVFDELITDSTIKKGDADKSGVNKLKEIEDFEYAIQKEQLIFFKKNFSINHNSKDFKIPMLSSTEAITCDNTDFTQADLDKNDNTKRNGIVFTIPKYDLNNKINGGVSEILRTAIISTYMPKHFFGLVNTFSQVQIINEPTLTWFNSIPYFSKNKINPNLIYSKIIPINTMDIHPWQLWIAIPDDIFYQTTNYKNAMNHYYIEIVVALLIILSLFFLQQKIIQKNITLVQNNHDLENQKEKLERDNLLLTVLSHDVANTLTIIKSSSQILKKLTNRMNESESLVKSNQYLDKQIVAAEVAIGVLSHVRELKAIEKGKIDLVLEPTSIGEIFQIAQVVSENNLTKKNIKLILNDQSEGRKFLCHKISFSTSVINNLISNAIKFSSENSEIIVSAKVADNRFIISIKDHGIGIPSSLAKILFEPNKNISRTGTSGEKGTGFGLSLAKNYVEFCGGSLTFETSTIGVTGTKFIISMQLEKI